MLRCSSCGTTDIDKLEPLEDGGTYCEACNTLTKPEPRHPPAPEPRRRRDLE